MSYEAPKIRAVGSVSDLTLGQDQTGDQDHILFIPLPGKTS
ncbi:lasso RiPP family leader peptide-containing protein [Humibacter sp.]|jgi:hypothetical protein|nr:lasso RiPP family leader peptide-containing protein [Humibacter sp.]HVX09503.1 lasso RiPP family leader peptide-containing protein [Humibacter sp.]